jgi:AraC-like DNA-binding protein
MSSRAAPAPSPIARFAPPYDRFEPQGLSPIGDVSQWRGQALIWHLRDARAQMQEVDFLAGRPRGLPLMVLLPHPDDIGAAVPLLRYIRDLRPRAIVPGSVLGAPEHMRNLLAAPPRNLADSVTRYLIDCGLLQDEIARKEVHRLLELSGELCSISQLARRMYTSRRTLGRHFGASRLPVPSHWLQFGRLLHVAMHLHNERTAVFRIAARAKYPDGFTLSNQMKRLIGYRPSEVRRLLGWEWIVEAWLAREELSRRGGDEDHREDR